MGRYPLAITLTFEAARQRWRVLDAFRFDVGGGWQAEVPAGFETDFASIPRPLWWLYPPAGRWGVAAVVHDYLYREFAVSRVLADAIFLDAMRFGGVRWWRRWILYLAVRLFGARHFHLGETQRP